MATKTFKANGTLGVLMISNYGLTDAALSNPQPYLSSINFHSGLTYLQISGYLAITNPNFGAVSPGDINNYVNTNHSSGDCFTAETLITLPDNSKKQIADILVGDKVLSKDGKSINTVTFIEKMLDTCWEYLYSPDNINKPFATINHPIYLNGKLHAIDPNITYNFYPWLGKIHKLNTNTQIIPSSGNTVYNLWTTGDGTYIVNDYGTHSLMYDGYFLQNCYTKKCLTQEEVQEIMKYFTSCGPEVIYGGYVINYTLGKLLQITALQKFVGKKLAKPGITRTLTAKLAYLIGKTLRICKRIK